MTVLMISDLPGAGEAEYRGLVDALGAQLVASAGFISHAAGPTESGYRVVELWASQEAHDAWFNTHVVPALPPGAPIPTHTYQTITNVLPG